MKTLRQIYTEFPDELHPLYSASEAKELFFLILEELLDKTRVKILLDFELELNPENQISLDQILQQLKSGKPFQYILQHAMFMELSFHVDENVLIPRQETEELVRWILEKESTGKILDIGTGSGCIAISLAKALPEAELWALDISESALLVAQENARVSESRVQFVKLDILEKLLHPELPEFDVLVSNPPYVLDSERNMMSEIVYDQEPSTALFVSDSDPLIFYRAILEFAEKHLVEQGRVYFEINEQMGAEIRELLEYYSFQEIEIKQDIFGKDRMVRALKSNR